MRTTRVETSRAPLAKQVEDIVMSAPVTDIHTHLYDPAFKKLLLWGIDDLLVYHYLVAEAFRYLELPYDKFWSLSKTRQADLIWDALFLQHSPVSEACRGVLTTLHAMGLDVKKRDLPALRRWFASQSVDRHITRCMELAGVRKIFMTNSPFDDLERPVWEKGFRRDDRFAAALRIDPLLLAWPETAPRLARWGYKVEAGVSRRKTFDEVRRFLADWTKRIGAHYVMISVPPEFVFPDKGITTQLIEQAVLPHCRDHGVPFALMLGVERATNPQLKLAGDGVGLSNLAAVRNLCAGFPENTFLATVLARENQHELCVLARKFRNLHAFGCWWFMNVPYLIDEITRLRLELLGLSFTPQHSDARVLDQIVYKWQHSRRLIAQALVDKYSDLAQTGWQVSRAEVERDVKDLFGGAFERFCEG
ncbi:MAG: glucuronate isomerase [Limisphaerales bacterium]